MRRIWKDRKDGGVAVMLGYWLFGWAAPLGCPVALTLALSRRAGEGTVVVGGGVSAMGVGWGVVGAVREPPLRVGRSERGWFLWFGVLR